MFVIRERLYAHPVPLLLLWAFVACSRMNFTFTYTILVPVKWRQLLKAWFSRWIDCRLFYDAVPTAAIIESDINNPLKPSCFFAYHKV
jgi:hypothetical protein